MSNIIKFKVGQRVQPLNGIVKKINRKTIDIWVSSWTVWLNRKSGWHANNVILRFDKSYFKQINDDEIFLYEKMPGDKAVYALLVDTNVWS